MAKQKNTFGYVSNTSVWMNNRKAVVVTEHGDGSIIVEEDKDLYRVYISHLWVDENVRRRGIGGRLLEKAETIASEWNAYDVVLWVDKRSDKWLAEWYRRNGYRNGVESGGYIFLIKTLNKMKTERSSSGRARD